MAEDCNCKQERRIDKLEEWKEGKPGIPGIEQRVFSIEGKLKDNGELGIMTKVSKMWEKYSNDTVDSGRRKANVSVIFQIGLALLQSGLLVALLTNS